MHVLSAKTKNQKLIEQKTSYYKHAIKIFLKIFKEQKNQLLKKNPLCFFLLISTLIVIVISFFVFSF